MRRLLALPLALLLPAVAMAQQPWTLQKAVGSKSLKLSGSLRIRHEGLSGQQRPGFKAGERLVSMRTLLFGEYDAGRLRFGAEVQDSRGWHADTKSPISTGEVNVLEPLQAYVAADFTPSWGAGSALTLQAGRMSVNMGSRRLIASDDYRNTANGVTGLRSELRWHGGWNATLLHALPQQRLPDDVPSLIHNTSHVDWESRAVQLTAGLLSTPARYAGGAFEVMAVRFTERDAPHRPTRDRALSNLDLRYVREPHAGKFDMELENIWQFGHASTGTAATATREDVRAAFRHVRAGYQWNAAAKPRLALDYDWVSGERGGDQIRRFDTLFGMRRADLAPSGLYALIGRANLESPGVRLEVVPTPRVDLFAGYRAFWLESRTDAFSTTGIRDATGQSGRFAGQQIDSRLRYWVVPRSLRAELNALLFMRGAFLRDAPNARADHETAFLALSLQATF